MHYLNLLISYLWKIAVFSFYTLPSYVINTLILPFTFISSWILPLIASDTKAITPATDNYQEMLSYKTLDDFGFEFREGRMLQKENGKPFEFVMYNDRKKDQERYERLGKVVEEHIFELLEEAGLKRVIIPFGAKENEAKSFVFVTENYDQADKLILIIHGAGAVRAGQWSRKLIINHSIESGSQLPYIKNALERGYGVIVTNSNLNYDEVSRKRIKGNETPQNHFDYVWKHFVKPKNGIENIAIVAHSYGGVITLDGAIKHSDLIRRVFAVALTDSVHHLQEKRLSNDYKKWLHNNCRNWVTSDKPLNEEETNDYIRSFADKDCPRVSAGTDVHEETSWKAIDEVWKFIDLQLSETLNSKESRKRKTDGPIDKVKGFFEKNKKKNSKDEVVDDANEVKTNVTFNEKDQTEGKSNVQDNIIKHTQESNKANQVDVAAKQNVLTDISNQTLGQVEADRSFQDETTEIGKESANSKSSDDSVNEKKKMDIQGDADLSLQGVTSKVEKEISNQKSSDNSEANAQKMDVQAETDLSYQVVTPEAGKESSNSKSSYDSEIKAQKMDVQAEADLSFQGVTADAGKESTNPISTNDSEIKDQKMDVDLEANKDVADDIADEGQSPRSGVQSDEL